MNSFRWVCAFIVCVSLAQAQAALGVTPGQQDTFSDGTTQGWVVGLLGSVPAKPPANVPSGGPAGANDPYLLLTADGGIGAGNRLTVINVSQWKGDYVSAGVVAIAMSLNNFGATELRLRLVFGDPSLNNEAISTQPIVLLPGSGWTSVVFPILPQDLNAVVGSVSAALSNATMVRISHSPDGMIPGPSIVASLGVDNVTALADTDRDGILDVGDDCTLVPNPAQIDADRDGFGNACDPDFDENGVVNFGDLARMKSAFFGNDPVVDLNGDNVVNFADLAILKKSFFKPAGPSGLPCAGHIPCSAPGL